MEFTIHPYHDVTRYAFGSTEEEVVTTNGRPLIRTDDPIMEEVQETRPGSSLVYIDDAFAEVTINEGEEALLDGLYIFNDANAARTLKSRSSFT